MGIPSNRDGFAQSLVTTLAKRSANQCANPDCNAITSGPSGVRTRAVNVGQAAHIFGASPGSARYDPAMSSAERSDITNAIWLCGNCHKMVDDDPSRYPAGLLFEWQSSHENSIAPVIGKAGMAARRRYEERHLEEFGKLSYLAERIVTEKGDLWEYKLTSEVLRSELTPVLRRWGAFQRKLYSKPLFRVGLNDSLNWILDRIGEIQNITESFDALLNVEFARAWGEPGVAGVDTDIVEVARLFAGACLAALDWEEAVRFTRVHEVFAPVKDLFIGTAGGIIDEAAKLPAFLACMLSDNPKGEYVLSLMLKLPSGWGDDVKAAFDRAYDAYQELS